MAILYRKYGKMMRNAALILVRLSSSASAFGVQSEDIQIVFENRASADSIIALYPDVEFERVIPVASNQEIETRHNESGIDLWYIVKHPSRAKTRSTNIFEKGSGIRGVFETQMITIPEYQPVSDIDFTQQKPLDSITRSTPAMNDPLYLRQ